jgi:hypothetical protein
MNRRSKFEKDFLAVDEYFPKLSFCWNLKSKHWIITGDLDICDTEGNYWNTFNISIFVPHTYPHCVPIVKENSALIKREDDWHISQEGICCLDIEHNLIVMSRRGIEIGSFIRDKVYPYFANQLYKLSENTYAGKEYSHHFEGILQYYVEDLNLLSEELTIRFLERIISHTFVGRNDKCPCGSTKKIKECHLESIEKIKDLGKTRIKKDLETLKSKMLSK